MISRDVPFLNPEQRWECPNCPLTHVTSDSRPHTPYHECRGLRGLNAPFVPAGTRARVEALEREDYVAGEMVQTDAEGRPVMSIRTERWDGSNDLTVLAPCATAESRAEGLG